MERSDVSTRRWLSAVVMATVLGATGCAGATEGAPLAASSTTSAVATPASTAAWDPCTIPDEAIEAAELAVDTKKANLLGERPISPDWSTCFWLNPLPDTWYTLGIFSSTFSLDYLREAGPFEQFTPVDGFDGLRFQRKIKYDEVSCGIAFGRDGGVIYFMLDGFVSAEPLEDPCVEVERVARSLRPFLPSSK